MRRKQGPRSSDSREEVACFNNTGIGSFSEDEVSGVLRVGSDGGGEARNATLIALRGGSEMKCFGLDEEQNGSEDLFGTLKAREKGGGFEGTVAYTTAYGGGNSNAIDVSTTLNARGTVGRMDFESETFIAHSLRGEGFDASGATPDKQDNNLTGRRLGVGWSVRRLTPL